MGFFVEHLPLGNFIKSRINSPAQVRDDRNPQVLVFQDERVVGRLLDFGVNIVDQCVRVYVCYAVLRSETGLRLTPLIR